MMLKHTVTLNDVQVQILREAVTGWLNGHNAAGIELEPAIKVNADDLIRILGRESLRGVAFDGWDQAHRPHYIRR